jgi:hypothetical protein
MKFIDLKLYILADRIHHLNARTRVRFERVLRRLKRRRDHVWSDLIAARDLPIEHATPMIDRIALEWEAIDRAIGRTLKMLRPVQ